MLNLDTPITTTYASLTALEESGEEPELEFHPDSFRSASQMMLFTLKRP
jgi:hypothetical protein